MIVYLTPSDLGESIMFKKFHFFFTLLVLSIMPGVKDITADEQFQPALAEAGTKLVAVDFFATWCGPCKMIAPKVHELSNKFPQVVFLKVDVDKCPTVQSVCGVRAMPTFQFYRNMQKIFEFSGADGAKLESTIEKYANEAEAGSGLLGLEPFINAAQVECLNQHDEHVVANVFKGDASYLESDCDEQLLITIPFTQPVKIQSLKLQAVDHDRAPKTIKLFVNNVTSLDFDNAESETATQEITLGPNDVNGNEIVPLKFVKFQNVRKLTIFVKDTQGSADTCAISRLSLLGFSVMSTEMKDFKRVSGEKGESGH